ncbi:hypothetical protein D9619_008495 [Psilocybe cf. subviscida]|uniref:FAD/NAD(P)-binding domain-containing protein n=1 Tax=Psilocybe cf. subviscida TaxID=2480587 RepID=A0A8H5F0V3_9AGAR|nr:hypothetical protein D9619_008495 [Psilocybe cf. subviscida]
MQVPCKMKPHFAIFLFLVAALPAFTQELPSQLLLALSPTDSHYKSSYQFTRPIRKIAVIGAGVGGLISYRELSQTGFDVHLFERDSVPGGNWHYTDEVAVNTSIPSNPNVSIGDFTPSLPPKGVMYPYIEIYRDGVTENAVRRRAHRAPKPIWESLTSNIPAPIQQIREIPWPIGTPWALPHRLVGRYIRAFASYHGLNSNDDKKHKVHYNTRLELAEKQPNGQWALVLKTLESHNDGELVKSTWRKEHFDALVVATGNYNAPYIPPIPGLEAWVERFPEHLLHTRNYRRPEFVQGENVLIVGAASSGGEISRDIINHAKNVFVSIRPHKAPVSTFPETNYLSRIPSNATIIGEIKCFLPPQHSDDIRKAKVELTNGTIITGLDHIIFATGYRYSYPFLPYHHNMTLGTQYADPLPEESDAIEPIVTDGTHLRALYLDAFYIPDPTLLFMNVNHGLVESFTYGEFVSLAAAKVWSGTADLPAQSELWRRYRRVYTKRKGYGRHFQYMGRQGAKEMMRFFQAWLNTAAAKYGGRMIDGLSEDLDQVAAIWAQAHYGARNNAVINSPSHSDAFNTLYNSANVTGPEDYYESPPEAMYNDYW